MMSRALVEHKHGANIYIFPYLEDILQLDFGREVRMK